MGLITRCKECDKDVPRWVGTLYETLPDMRGIAPFRFPTAMGT